MCSCPEGALAGFFEVVIPHLDERQRRLAFSALAEALGRGEPARVAEATMSLAMRGISG